MSLATEVWGKVLRYNLGGGEETMQHDARRMPDTMRVWTLGSFQVSVGTRTIAESAWRLRKAAAKVKLLALSPGHRLHREQVIFFDTPGGASCVGRHPKVSTYLQLWPYAEVDLGHNR